MFSATSGMHSAINVSNRNHHLHFKNIAQFMRATTSEISVAPKASLLTHVRNPCFAVTSQHWNAVNISLETAVKHHMTIKCLPYVYLLGKYTYVESMICGRIHKTSLSLKSTVEVIRSAIFFNALELISTLYKPILLFSDPNICTNHIYV